MGWYKLGPSNIEKSKFMDPQGLSLYFYMVSAKNSDTQEILQIWGTKHSSLWAVAISEWVPTYRGLV